MANFPVVIGTLGLIVGLRKALLGTGGPMGRKNGKRAGPDPTDERTKQLHENYTEAPQGPPGTAEPSPTLP